MRKHDAGHWGRECGKFGFGNVQAYINKCECERKTLFMLQILYVLVNYSYIDKRNYILTIPRSIFLKTKEISFKKSANICFLWGDISNDVSTYFSKLFFRV